MPPIGRSTRRDTKDNIVWIGRCLQTENAMCLQPSLSKDGIALPKFWHLILVSLFCAVKILRICQLVHRLLVVTSRLGLQTSVPSFVGYRLFLPCRNLLACSFVRNTTFDGNKCLQNGAHTQTPTVHRPNNRKVVRRSNRTHNTHSTIAANAQHQKYNDGNRKREKIQQIISQWCGSSGLRL